MRAWGPRKGGGWITVSGSRGAAGYKALENFRNAQAGGFLDAIIQINEMPRELARQERADSSLAGAHESGETNHLDAGLGPTQRRRLDHGFWKPRRGRLPCGASS